MISTSRFGSRFTRPIENNRGMTLIEIMVVLLIVGGLMTFLGKSVYDNLKNANVKQTRMRFTEIAKALEMYNGDCGGFPSTEHGLKALTEDPGKDVCPNWGPQPYSKASVIKDAWNQPIIYESDGTTFVLKSLGADRREGGTGDKKDLLSTDEGT